MHTLMERVRPTREASVSGPRELLVTPSSSAVVATEELDWVCPTTEWRSPSSSMVGTPVASLFFSSVAIADVAADRAFTSTLDSFVRNGGQLGDIYPTLLPLTIPEIRDADGAGKTVGK